MRRLHDAAAEHLRRHGRPPSIGDLTGGDPVAASDPWGSESGLDAHRGGRFWLVSFGPDGLDWTDDVIRWPAESASGR